jgi:hypothetical protein
MKQSIERAARVHPGVVHHSMDHYVMDTRTEDGAVAAYLSLYSLAYMPEVGTGYVAFVRVRDETGDLNCEMVLAESIELGVRMQERISKLIKTSDVSLGIGPNLEMEPTVASFERQGWTDGPGFRITAGTRSVDARWHNPGTVHWIAAPKGSLHHDRDILGTMIPFSNAELKIDSAPIPGNPYQDPWWQHRLDIPFSSTHVSLGDTALESAGPWWSEQH